MRVPSTSLCLVAAAGLTLGACSASKPEPTSPPSAAATVTEDRDEASRKEAARRLEELEATIADARRRIAAAEGTPALTRQQRLLLSETRRAVVVANVSLQKARTAMVAGDYAAASLATDGAADKLRAVAEGKSVTSAQQEAGSRR